MEIYILDTSYNIVSVIDSFTAFIWTTRYKDVSEFELHLPPETSELKHLVRGNYMVIKDSEKTMIIEDKGFSSYEDEGETLKISGRSLESILDRRIVWTKTLIEGNLQNGIKKLITEAFISPSDSKRKIPNLKFKDSTDPRITKLKIEPVEFLGQDILSIVTDFCNTYGLGFQILLYKDGTMEFSLYMGEDRSYDQTKNNFVIFSPKYDNLFGTNYYESDATHKNVILASGDFDGETTKFVEVTGSGNVTGLNRREMYGEISGIVTYIDDEKISEEDFEKQLKEKGAEELAEYPVLKAYEGEIEATIQFIYGQDFFLGDIVQVVNKYNIESRSRIEEVILSEDVNGKALYPTFVGMEK